MPFPCSKLSGRDGLFHFIPSLSRLSELHMAILLPRRTQWPVETTHTVHVLSVLRLLLLPDRIIPVVAGHFGVVRAAEAREAHQSLHLLRLLITAVLIVHIHRVLAARCNAIRPRQYAPRVLARARLRAARRRVRLVCLLLLMLLLLPTACRTVRGWRCASRSARRRAPSRIVPGIVRPRAPRSRASICSAQKQSARHPRAVVRDWGRKCHLSSSDLSPDSRSCPSGAGRRAAIWTCCRASRLRRRRLVVGLVCCCCGRRRPTSAPSPGGGTACWAGRVQALLR